MLVCYRYWQQIHWMSNTKGKAPINWHFTCQLTHINENFKEWYFSNIQSTSWLIRSLILMIKMIWKRKGMTWFHVAMQKKIEQIQILTLVPDKWSRMHCSEYFNVFEYLVWTSHEIKKVAEIIAKPAPKKRKNYHHWSTWSGNKRLWGWQVSIGRCLKRKTVLVKLSKGVHKQKLCNL